LAVRLLKAGTLRQSRHKTKKLCANGCGQPAVARDYECGKDLCWFHLVMEHPYQVSCSKHNREPLKMCRYYGP
jgi:hypothetical protein